jgi:hypothetical protein
MYTKWFQTGGVDLQKNVARSQIVILIDAFIYYFWLVVVFWLSLFIIVWQFCFSYALYFILIAIGAGMCTFLEVALPGISAARQITKVREKNGSCVRACVRKRVNDWVSNYLGVLLIVSRSELPSLSLCSVKRWRISIVSEKN